MFNKSAVDKMVADLQAAVGGPGSEPTPKQMAILERIVKERQLNYTTSDLKQMTQEVASCIIGRRPIK